MLLVQKCVIIFGEIKLDEIILSIRNVSSIFLLSSGVGRVVQWCWVNFQCRGVLLIWVRVGQGPTALAVGAGGVVWTFFSRFLFSFSLSLGDGPI